ncbi:MFS transporter [Alicyclobacillus dauci]|uniref:MFS transporter n=1 Tax=Alicyclobacillus dauci TaxID=1475485 RepID=A0ABY6YYV0_9BACL|nr:MFS transporter [Alicyclobacillus dauci]WAH35301.1 MFS transporter [Alicyclobacillus dauci]
MERRSWLFILLFASIVAMLPNSILFPAESVLASHLHQPLNFIGWMITLYAAAYVLSTPVLGIISDFLGRRSVLTLGLILFAIGGTVPVWTGDPLLILVGRAVMGVGSAGIQPMVDSMIGDIYPPGKGRRQAFAYFGAAIAVAEALVPFLGGSVASVWWKGVFILYGTALVSAALCLRLNVQRQLDGGAEKLTVSSYALSMRVAMKRPGLALTVVGAMVFGVVYFGVCALLPMVPTGGHSSFSNGLLFLPLGILWISVSACFARWSQVRNLHRLIGAGTLLLAGATLLLAHAHSYPVVYLTSACWGIGSAILCTLFTWVVNDESPDAVRGAMNGIYNAAYVLGFSIGAPLFLQLSDRFGLTRAVDIGVTILVVLAPILYFAYRFGLHQRAATRTTVTKAS